MRTSVQDASQKAAPTNQIPKMNNERAPMTTRTRLRSLPGLLAFALLTRLQAAAAPADDDHERGDVPGWVMITLMSAVLVAAILVVAQDALLELFESAIAQVRR